MPRISGEKRSVRIAINLTPSEAKMFDLGRGQTRRAIASRYLSLMLKPPKPPAPEVAKLTADLNRIGNNLNQIARALNINSLDKTELELAQIQIMKLRESLTS